MVAWGLSDGWRKLRLTVRWPAVRMGTNIARRFGAAEPAPNRLGPSKIASA